MSAGLAPEFALVADRKVLGYFNPNDPRFLTLTDGRGGILGTWLRRGLVGHDDRSALSAAIRHSVSALNTAKGRATELATGERAELAAMRTHNGVTVDEEPWAHMTTPSLDQPRPTTSWMAVRLVVMRWLLSILRA